MNDTTKYYQEHFDSLCDNFLIILTNLCNAIKPNEQVITQKGSCERWNLIALPRSRCNHNYHSHKLIVRI